MAAEITKVDVYAGTIKDRPGALAETLDLVAEAGASLEFVIARRDKPGAGVVFLAPLRGGKQLAAANKAKLHKTQSLHSLRLVCNDRPGIGARITGALGEAGINMRGISAASIGRKCVVYFAFDTEADAKKARRVLRKLFPKR